MEPVALVVDKLKCFVKSSEDFVKGLIHHQDNPIEILKRLQREAFSDLMKLRDRQEKFERMLSFYKISQGNPFRESSTHLRGEVDVLGALLMMDSADQHNCDALCRSGIRTGVESKFTFETTIRQKDTLVAEFLASQKEEESCGDVPGSALSLSKVSYMANVNHWFSVIAIPVGAQCRDFGVATSSSNLGKGMADFSSFGPPLLTEQQNGGAIGLTVRKPDVVASLAQFVSGLGIPGSVRTRHCFSTFGQVVCRLTRGTKLTLMGLHQVPRSSSLGALTIPVRISKRREAPETSLEASSPPMRTVTEETISSGSIAMMLESNLDESTRIGGWVEIKKSNPKCIQWAVTLSDTPENEMGWGLSLGGIGQGPKCWDHFQAEAFLKFNLSERLSLQPGLVYVMDETSRIPALMIRSSWTL